MAREYYRMGRMRDSYENYLKKRQEWRRKGYSVQAAVDFKTYVSNYDVLKLKGVKNIAAELARGDLYSTHTEAKRYLDIAEKSGIELPEDMRTVKGFKKYSHRLMETDYNGIPIRWKSVAQGLYMAVKNGLGGDSADEAFGY